MSGSAQILAWNKLALSQEGHSVITSTSSGHPGEVFFWVYDDKNVILQNLT